MEVALVGFVGAGLTSLSAGFGIAVPEGAITNGYELVRFLSREDDRRTKSMVMQSVGEIWQDWRASKLPPEIARQHVSCLPLLMDRHRHTDELLVGAIGAATASAKQGGHGNTIHGRRLAAHIVACAREANTMAEFGMSDPIAFFFLERLYTRLLVERGYFDSLLPMLDVYFYKGLWRGSADTALSNAAAANASEAGASDRPPQSPPATLSQVREVEEPVLEVQAADPTTSDASFVIDGDCDADSTDHDSAAAAIEPADRPRGEPGQPAPRACADFQDLARALTDIAAGTPAGRQLREAASCALNAGDPQLADRRLADAEDAELQAAQTDIVNVRQFLRCATETRAARARIEEIRGNWRRAARHYAAAVRCLPTSDGEGRGALLTRQALALMKQGELHDDTPALSEAAAVFAEAGAVQVASSAPEDWAAGQLMLAGLLVVLGEREANIERFEAAARHARAASEIWSQSRNSVEWARAQLMFADALRLRGESVRSTIDLEEAQFAYRAALGVFARDRSPEDWVMASANLGQVMVRLGEISADTEAFGLGLQQIDSALGLAARLGIDLDIAKLQTARGNALLGLFAAHDSERLAAEATEAFSLALAACDQLKHPSKALSMHHRFGMAMWAYGARTGAIDILSEAALELTAVLDDAELLGDAARMRELQEDLAVLKADIARVSAERRPQSLKIA